MPRLTVSRAGDEVHEVWQAGYFNDAGRDFQATFDGTSTPFWTRCEPGPSRPSTREPAD